MLTQPSMALLNSLQGTETPEYATRAVRGKLRIRKLADPLDQVDEIVAKLFDDSDDPNDAKINRRLRTRRTDRLGYDRATGHLLYNGRRCCFDMTMQLDAKLGTLRFPHRQVCAGCGTEYEVFSTFAKEGR